MSMTKLAIEKAFMLIEPGPVVLVTTRDKGRDNIMTITWHMVLDFDPKIAMETGPWNYSYNALINTKECVIAIPTVDLAEKVVGIGDCSGSNVDKFKKFDLTPIPASTVKAPLIAECLACVECRVIEYLKSQSIFILQGVCAWTDKERKERRTFHANGDGTFVVDGDTINLRHLMEDKLPPGV
jgi:flavin reductase (DIM6/NTAB) family NADH-FMN oxidoreductase RutF